MPLPRDLFIEEGRADLKNYVKAKFFVSYPEGLGKAVELIIRTQTQTGGMKFRIGDVPTPLIIDNFNPQAREGNVEILYPIDFFDPRYGGITELLNFLLGEVFEMSFFDKIRLDDLWLPDRLIQEFTGPEWGIEGIRERLGVKERPLLAVVIRPLFFKEHKAYARRCREIAEAGVDMVVDPHIKPPFRYPPLKDRVYHAISELEEVGRPILYVVNIGGDRPLAALKQIEEALDEMGSVKNVQPAVGISFTPQNFDTIRTVVEDTEADLPVEAHSSIMSVMTWDMNKCCVNLSVLVKLARLAGADMVHAGSYSAVKKYSIPGLTLPRNYRMLTMPLVNIKPSFHIAAGSVNPLWVYEHVYEFRGTDIIFVVGDYVYRRGFKEGVKNMKEALSDACELHRKRMEGEEKEFDDFMEKVREWLEAGDEEPSNESVIKWIRGKKK